jgi:uncharacterized SAM-binding protein YcdF (DUF218 family)
MLPPVQTAQAPRASRPAVLDSSQSASPSVPPQATHAVVVFGRGLNKKTGKPTPALVRRLETTLAQAKKDPDALIVVSGGAAHNQFPEAEGMRDWLVQHGVPSSRILVEGQSNDTIENAENVAKLLEGGKVKNVTVVTERYHVHRAHELLESALSHRGVKAKLDDAPAPDGLSGLAKLKMSLSEERLLVLDRANQEWRHLSDGHSFFG